MVLEKLANLISDKIPTPNKFTRAMGELIRQAREEAGLSQAELARLIYRRQATISDIENGKSEVSAGTLTLLAAALDKPIIYFFPRWILRELKAEDLDIEEQELLLHFRHISDKRLRRLAIRQLKLLADTGLESFRGTIGQYPENHAPQ